MSATKIYTGCSGFYNKHWKEIFYPADMPQKLWFQYYAEKFKTLELNVTFYKFPTEKVLNGWYTKAPHDFIFCVKAPRAITHYKKLKDCEQLLNDFYTVCHSGLKEKLGCLLFQFPPSFIYNEQNLNLLIAALHTDTQVVAEFRHASWWNPEVYHTLAQHNIIFCTIDHPTLPNDFVINHHTAYIRMHGSPQLFYSEYSHTKLQQLHEQLLHHKKLTQAFVFFNNTASTAGILNAQEFDRMAGGNKRLSNAPRSITT